MKDMPDYQRQIYRPRDPLKELLQALKMLAWGFSFPMFVLMLIFSLVVLTAAFPKVLAWFASTNSTGAIFLAIIPDPVGFYAGTPLIQIWFTFVFVTVFGSVIFGIAQLTESSRRGVLARIFSGPDRANSGLEVTAKLFMMTAFVYLVYVLFITLFTIQPTSPDFESIPIYGRIYGYVNAAVNEEIISRTFLIGIPLLIIETLAAKTRKLRRYLIGGGLPINLTTTILIVFSALMFALAHVGGWDLYKTPTTFIAGLALGYLFVKHGIFASILLHFATNFFLVSPEIWPDSFALTSLTALVWIFMGFTGAYFFVHYFLRVLHLPKILAGKQLKEIGEEAERRTGASVEEHENIFVCKNCGGYRARYDSEDHSLICLNCGYRDRP